MRVFDLLALYVTDDWFDYILTKEEYTLLGLISRKYDLVDYHNKFGRITLFTDDLYLPFVDVTKEEYPESIYEVKHMINFYGSQMKLLNFLINHQLLPTRELHKIFVLIRRDTKQKYKSLLHWRVYNKMVWKALV